MEDVAGGVVEATTEATPVDQAAPQVQPEGVEEAPAAQKFRVEFPTGTVYESEQDWYNGTLQKDLYIAELKGQLAAVQNFGPQPAQVQTANNPIMDLAASIEQELLADPQFRNADPQAIKEQAIIQARALSIGEKRIEQRLASMEHQRFVEATPELNTPLAQEVFDAAQRQGRPFNTPHEHLQAVHAEMWRRSQSGQQPAQQQRFGVNGAVNAAQLGGRIFQGAGAGTTPQAEAPVPEYVQRALDIAKQAGHTSPEAIERIKARAMENYAKFGGR